MASGTNASLHIFLPRFSCDALPFIASGHKNSCYMQNHPCDSTALQSGTQWHSGEFQESTTAFQLSRGSVQPPGAGRAPVPQGALDGRGSKAAAEMDNNLEQQVELLAQGDAAMPGGGAADNLATEAQVFCRGPAQLTTQRRAPNLVPKVVSYAGAGCAGLPI